MQNNILYDRFTTLPNTGNHFPRPRIDKLMANALNYSLVLVTAGPGWGKTQAISSFIQNSGNHFVWLQFSKLDNYSVRFWENFTHAVNIQNPALAYRLSAFGFPNTAALFHNFLHIFADLTVDIDKLIFVIDDIHLITDQFILNFIENLLYARLKNLNVILIGRSLPDLSLEGLHIQDTASQITEENLRFTRKEALDYFLGQNIILPKDTFEKIYVSNGGWISALYLINLSLRKKGGTTENILTLAKRQIFELIEQEIFSKYPEETRHILIEWSLFERIPVGFIKKQSKHNLTLMMEVEKTNMFVHFDPLTETYDIHDLFLEFLTEKQDMYLTDTELKEAHFKIAGWHHKHGSKIEALDHYRLSGHHEEIWEIIRTYEMQAPPEVCSFFLGLVEGFPEEFKEKFPLIAVIHARLYLLTGRLEESIRKFMEIIHKYEALPPTAEHKAILGEVFIHLGMVSQLSLDYKFLYYFKKAVEYLPLGSSLVDNKAGYCDGQFMVLIKENTPGEIDRFLEYVMEAMPYCAKAMNGNGYGVEYVTKAEASYYRNNMKEAESAAYTAIHKAGQQQQHDTVCGAYFVLVCIYVNEGNYTKINDCIRQLDKKIAAALESESKRSSNIKRYVYTYTVLKSWYYATMECYDKIPDWITRQDARHKVPSAGYYSRDQFIHANYLLYTQNYQELSGLLEALESSYNMSGALFPRLYTQILKAISFHKTGSIPEAMAAFQAAYGLAHANSIVMPFIEYGKYMRALIYTARRSKENAVPDAWMDEIYTKATTYEKRLNSIRAQYQQALGLSHETSAQLTKRETEILRYLCQGLTIKEIANTLYVSVSAVKKTLNNIYAKLGATNKADAVRIAVQKDLHK